MDEVPTPEIYKARVHGVAQTLAIALIAAIAYSGCAGGRALAGRDLSERGPVAADAYARRQCEGVPAGDVAPGLSGLEVIRVSVLERIVRYRGTIVEGAAAVVPTSGRSFDAMDALMRCRAARAPVVGDPLDPFAVPGASVRVFRDDGDAVIVQIRSRRVDGAEEIVRRVKRLVRGDDEMGAGQVNTDGHGGTGDQRTRIPTPPRSPGGVAPPVAGPLRPVWRP